MSTWDVAVSGKKQGRPQLDALMGAARDRAFDQVLVWKFDRFARSTKHLLSALEEFDHLGIGFVSFRDQIDTSSPMGRVMFTLIGAMAELESSLISERVTAGMKAAKAKGKNVGRPRTPRRIVARIEKTRPYNKDERPADSPERLGKRIWPKCRGKYRQRSPSNGALRSL